VLAALAPAGCGGGEEPSDPAALDAIKRAAPRTEKEGTARATMTMVSKPDRELDVLMRGVMGLDNDRARMTVRYNSDPEDESLEGFEAETFIDGDDVYARAAGDRRWILTPPDENSFATGMSDSLGYLAGVVGEVKKEGEESVRGEPATRYRATVDLAEVAKHLPADQRDRYRATIDQAFGSKRLPVQVWLDRQGRMARMRYDIRFGRSVREQGEDGLLVDLTLFDFGVEDDLEPPPARLVDDSP
jgi:hypothetical protein